VTKRKRRKKRSLLPYLALLACAGVGVWLYTREAKKPLTREAAREEPTPPPAPTPRPRVKDAKPKPVPADFEAGSKESGPALALRPRV